MIVLADEYPKVFRFTTSIFPQKNDDVITSPYNSLLSLNELIKYSDCVFPIDNQALINIVNSNQKNKESNDKEEKTPFKQMNSIVANMLSNLTASMRFEGTLNIDLNEITMNLIPFPQLKFLIPAMNFE